MWKSTWKVNRNSTVNDDFFHDKQTSTLTIIIHYYWIIFNRIINIYDYYFKFFEWTMKWNEIKSKRRMKKKKKKKKINEVCCGQSAGNWCCLWRDGFGKKRKRPRPPRSSRGKLELFLVPPFFLKKKIALFIIWFRFLKIIKNFINQFYFYE